MTTAPVLTITEELLQELERASEYKHLCMVEVHPFALRAILAERAELKRDAERWRYARDILTVEAIEYAQSEFLNFGFPPDEYESIRADLTIDTAMQERQE